MSLLRHEDGGSKPIFPILIIIAIVVYTLLCIFVFFPAIDKLAGHLKG